MGTDWPEEVAEAGDVYYFQPGHVLMYDEPSEVLEFNPAATLKLLMDHIERLASQYDLAAHVNDGDAPRLGSTNR